MAKHRKKQGNDSALGLTRPDFPAEHSMELAGILENTLAKNSKPLRVDDFLRILHFPRKQKKELERTLLTLQAQGKVARSPGGGFALADTLKTVTGVLAVQRAGMGFITTGRHDADIYVHPAHMGDAWHGDTVEAVILPGRRGRSAEGRITKIISRGQKELAVYAVKRQRDGTWTAVPASPRMQALFSVDVSNLPGPVAHENLLLVKPGDKIGHGLWEAVATCNLENEETPAAQERLTKSNHSVPDSFSAAVLKETSGLPKDPAQNDFEHRADLRHVDFVTIDGESAKDFDDAIFVEETAKTPSGPHFRLMVAIADVSHYVQPGSALDNEARLRGNSYYFPLSVEPMLPEALSNGLCSLRPDQPRLAMVAEIEFSSSGTPGKSRFYQAVIESKARLTYEQVNAALELNEPLERKALGKLLPMLEDANRLARILAKRRDERGSLDFDLPEPEFYFDDTGTIAGIRPRPKLFAHRLIEEFMVAANEAVARFITGHNQSMLYRVHPAPSEEKLEALFNMLGRSGLSIPGRNTGYPAEEYLAPENAVTELLAARASQTQARLAAKRERKLALKDKNDRKGGKKARVSGKGKTIIPTALELRNVLEQSRGSSQEYIINRLILRSMMQAQYSLDNEGHYGLASECYCHFTSPIRRYADLTVHRSLKRVLKEMPKGSEAKGGGNLGDNDVENREAGNTRGAVRTGSSGLSPNFLANTANHINSTERTAMEAEREIQKRLTVLYLKNHLGEEFAGVISGVTDFGFFVELDGVLAEGMVRLSSLGDDYYDYFPERQELVGRGTNRSFTLGGRLRVKLIDVSLSRQEVSLALLDNAQSSGSREKTPRNRGDRDTKKPKDRARPGKARRK